MFTLTPTFNMFTIAPFVHNKKQPSGNRLLLVERRFRYEFGSVIHIPIINYIIDKSQKTLNFINVLFLFMLLCTMLSQILIMCIPCIRFMRTPTLHGNVAPVSPVDVPHMKYSSNNTILDCFNP